jgi:hypothetical protein
MSESRGRVASHCSHFSQVEEMLVGERGREMNGTLALCFVMFDIACKTFSASVFGKLMFGPLVTPWMSEELVGWPEEDFFRVWLVMPLSTRKTASSKSRASLGNFWVSLCMASESFCIACLCCSVLSGLHSVTHLWPDSHLEIPLQCTHLNSLLWSGGSQLVMDDLQDSM